MGRMRTPGASDSSNTGLPYDFFSMTFPHLGHFTRMCPLPRGTESIWPQFLHLKYIVVLRLAHIFWAVRLVRSKFVLLDELGLGR